MSLNNTERDKRIIELLIHRKSVLEAFQRDIEYALKHDDIPFAAPAGIMFTQLVQIETTIRTLRDV